MRGKSRQHSLDNGIGMGAADGSMACKNRAPWSSFSSPCHLLAGSKLIWKGAAPASLLARLLARLLALLLLVPRLRKMSGVESLKWVDTISGSPSMAPRKQPGTLAIRLHTYMCVAHLFLDHVLAVWRVASNW